MERESITSPAQYFVLKTARLYDLPTVRSSNDETDRRVSLDPVNPTFSQVVSSSTNALASSQNLT
jgi:hypothetical protein